MNINRCAACTLLLVWLAATGNAQELLWNVDGFRSAVPMDDLTADGLPEILVPDPFNSSAALFGGAFFVLSSADGSVLYSYVGNQNHGFFGQSVSPVGDVNGDQIGDYASASVELPIATRAGEINIYSGSSGALLRTITGALPNDQLGATLKKAGDLNQDGCPDLVTTSFRGIHVFSGCDGSPLLEVFPVTNIPAYAGGAVDVNGDTFPDYLVTIVDASNGLPDSMKIYSGQDGSELFSVSTQSPTGANYGLMPTLLGDLDGDGITDFASRAWGPDLVEDSFVAVFSSVTGSIIYEYADGTWVGPTGDLNDDGVADFSVGFSSITSVTPGPGLIRLYSGKTGFVFEEIRGLGENEALGTYLNSVGDYNGDGVPDILAAAPNATDASGAVVGQLRIYAGVELGLFATPADPMVGELLTLVLGEGDPGDPSLLAATELAGTPLFVPLTGIQPLNSSGGFTISTVLGPALSGLDFTLQGYSITRGSLRVSASERILIP